MRLLFVIPFSLAPFNTSCHLCFQSALQCTITDTTHIHLVSNRAYISLQGRVYGLLAPLLDGTFSVDEILQKLHPHISAAEVFWTLVRLVHKGYVVSATHSSATTFDTCMDLLGVDASTAQAQADTIRFALTSLGAVAPNEFLDALQLFHLKPASEGTIHLVLTDSYLHPQLDAINQHALQTGVSWLPLCPVGDTIWVGPRIQPGTTSCWACLAHRLRGNYLVNPALFDQPANQHVPDEAEQIRHTPRSPSLAAILIARQLLSGTLHLLKDTVSTLDVFSFAHHHYPVTRQIYCPACGHPRELYAPPPSPPAIQQSPKHFTADGGHRIVTPDETLARSAHLVNPVTGVVLYIEPCHDQDKHVPNYVYQADYILVKPTHTTHTTYPWIPRSYGKGSTTSQAQASALCEAIERYSGLFQAHDVHLRASAAALGDQAVHPNACMNFSQKQYDHRHEWNARHARSLFVPEPFDRHQEIDWTAVWSLTTCAWTYIPTAYCFYMYPSPDGRIFCRADSNGNAAGNSLEEAIVQGFMELVERDSVALWWYNRIQRPAVHLTHFNDPWIAAMQTMYQSLHRSLWVLDLQTDLGIPTFAAVSCRVEETYIEDIILGFGAHMDARIALLRSISEANQSLALRKNQRTPPQFQHITVHDGAFLIPDPSVHPKEPSAYATHTSDDLRDDIVSCVTLAQTHGMETLILDQTRPDVGLHVVKVIVPGMRHYWPRFAPGRLYDVPATLGWVPAPLTEDDMNPIWLPG